MTILYTPRDADWIWEPSFLACAILYDSVSLPLLQTAAFYGNIIYNDDGEIDDAGWYFHNLSSIRSWTELGEQEKYLQSLKDLKIIGDITPPTTINNNMSMERDCDVAVFEANILGQYASAGLQVIGETKHQYAAGAGMYHAYSLAPKNYSESYAISKDSSTLEHRMLIDAHTKHKFIQSLFWHVMPEIFIGKLEGVLQEGASKRNLKIPQLVDFLYEIRSATAETRYAFRSFSAMLLNIPWEEGEEVVNAILEDRKLDLIDAYNAYKSPISRVVRRLGGRVRWIKMLVKLTALDMLGAATEALTWGENQPVIGKRERNKAFAFLLSSEQHMRSWARLRSTAVP